MSKRYYHAELDDSGIKRKLKDIVKNYPKVENKALRQGAVYFAQELEKNTPVGPHRPKDKYGPHTNYSETHMKDDVKWQKKGEGTYVVGYGVDTAWRAVFVNDGTIKMSGQHFFEKTVQSQIDEINKIVADTVRRELL